MLYFAKDSPHSIACHVSDDRRVQRERYEDNPTGRCTKTSGDDQFLAGLSPRKPRQTFVTFGCHSDPETLLGRTSAIGHRSRSRANCGSSLMWSSRGEANV